MPDFTVRQLDASTWDAFAELVERNNGVYGGCWCIGWHLRPGVAYSDYRSAKEELVRTDQAHAALVFDEDGQAQGWCQYGSVEELPNIKHSRRYREEPPTTPAWRIACCFVDKRHRGQGVMRVAVGGALTQIAERGGGLVEAISEVTDTHPPPPARVDLPLLHAHQHTPVNHVHLVEPDLHHGGQGRAPCVQVEGGAMVNTADLAFQQLAVVERVALVGAAVGQGEELAALADDDHLGVAQLPGRDGLVFVRSRGPDVVAL